MVSRELVAASTRPLVLAILARGESYGYAIIQEIRERSEGELEWTEGMLYPVLHRLEERGRKYYVLSEGGGRALAAEKADWAAVDGLLRTMWGETRCAI